MAKSATTPFLNGALGTVVLTPGARDFFCRIQISGDFTGLSLNVSGSIEDGTAPAYSALAFIDESTYADNATGSFTTIAVPKMLQLNCSMLTSIKVNVTAVASGTANVTILTSDFARLTQVAGG